MILFGENELEGVIWARIYQSMKQILYIFKSLVGRWTKIYGFLSQKFYELKYKYKYIDN